MPELQTSRAYCQRQVDALWDEVKRFENPHNYYVDLSQKLWDIKQSLLTSHEMARGPPAAGASLPPGGFFAPFGE